MSAMLYGLPKAACLLRRRMWQILVTGSMRCNNGQARILSYFANKNTEARPCQRDCNEAAIS